MVRGVYRDMFVGEEFVMMIETYVERELDISFDFFWKRIINLSSRDESLKLSSYNHY